MNELVKQVNEWIDKEIFEEEETVIVCKTEQDEKEVSDEVSEILSRVVTEAMSSSHSVVKREGKAYITISLNAYSKEGRKEVFRLLTSQLQDKFDVEGGTLLDTTEVEVFGVFNKRKNAEDAWERFPGAINRVMKEELNALSTCKATCTEHFTKDGRAVGTVLSVTVRVESEGDKKPKEHIVKKIANRVMDQVSRTCKGITYLKERLLKRMNDMSDEQKVIHSLKEREVTIFQPTTNKVSDFLNAASLFATHSYFNEFTSGTEEEVRIEGSGEVTLTNEASEGSLTKEDLVQRIGFRYIFDEALSEQERERIRTREETEESRTRRAKAFGEGYIRFVSGESKETKRINARILAYTSEKLAVEYTDTPYARELLEKNKDSRAFEEAVGRYISVRMRGEAASIFKSALIQLDIPHTEGSGGGVKLYTIETRTFLNRYDEIYKVVTELRESGAKVDYILKNDITRTFIKILESHLK